VTRVVIATSGWASWPDFGGATWVPMQYLLGLSRLGVEAIWVDHLGPVDPIHDAHSLDYLIEHFGATARTFGFADGWSVVHEGSRDHFGIPGKDVEAFAAEADLLVGLSGKGLPDGSPLLRIPTRAYVDLDPGFTQIWAHVVDMRLAQYNVFFTVGLNVGTPDFPISTQGIRWRSMLPPVVLDLWPANIDPSCQRFSTIGDYWGHQFVNFNGQYYGSKREEFLRFVGVPSAAGQPIEAALTLAPTDHEEVGLLTANRWVLLDPYLYAGDPQAYREFIRYSRAEFSVAKNGYVRSCSGWVSDRSACYLASGKPVLVQSTGIEPHLPTGMGLLTFRTPDEAVAGIRAINADYLAHARTARELAERWFDSDRVLRGFLERALS
jgi:hypothetical protein